MLTCVVSQVYVNNPALTGKVASVLQAGHILFTRFQPHESHVPFLLQVCMLHSEFTSHAANRRMVSKRVTLPLYQMLLALRDKSHVF